MEIFVKFWKLLEIVTQKGEEVKDCEVWEWV
jgi:hypothetical protein